VCTDYGNFNQLERKHDVPIRVLTVPVPKEPSTKVTTKKPKQLEIGTPHYQNPPSFKSKEWHQKTPSMSGGKPASQKTAKK